MPRAEARAQGTLMRTIDTTKLWVVHHATATTHPEIVGPGGICMDLCDATNEQADEIAEILNNSTGAQLAEGQLAEFAGLCSVTLFAGQCEVTYRAPSADEVMSMVEAGKQSYAVEHESGTLQPVDWSVMQIAREPGKPDAGRTQVIYNLNARIQSLSKDLERYRELAEERNARRMVLKRELDHYKVLANERQEKIQQIAKECNTLNERLNQATYERDAWEANAASYSRNTDYYRDIVDRCGRAIGIEAFTADDGGIHDTPLRAKVAELVEQLCVERAKDARTKDAAARLSAKLHEIFENPAYQGVFASAAIHGVKYAGPNCAGELLVLDAALSEVRSEQRAATVSEATDRMMNSGISPEAPTEFDYAVAHPTDAQRAQIRKVLEEQAGRTGVGMGAAIGGRGPCAKQTVTATIVMPNGNRFVGTNDCLNAQTTCPRDAAGYKTGEGYHLCAEVCQQTGHAEINALRAAGTAAKGAFMYIEGHTYACQPCIAEMVRAEIHWYKFSAPPAQVEPTNPTPCSCSADLPRPNINDLDKAQAAGYLQGVREQQEKLVAEIPELSVMRSAIIEQSPEYYALIFKFQGPTELYRAAAEWHKVTKWISNLK
jgi:deoxycytidylate deaminase